MEAQLELSELVDATRPFEDFLFARGYIFASGHPPVAPESWLRDKFESYHLAHDPSLTVERYAGRDVSILCLGVLFDPRNPSKDSDECVRELGRKLADSEQAFLREMGYMMGRHVVAYKRGQDLRLVTDATAMKPAFYLLRRGRFVASHMNLIALNSNEVVRREHLSTRYGYPGIRTPRRYIRVLTPNTALDLRTLKPSRFWPRERLKPISLKEGVAGVSALFEGGFAHIAARWQPLVSLTAGIDSRTTVAVTKPYEKTRYFTYRQPDDPQSAALDPNFAAEFRARTGRDVTVFDNDVDDADEAWQAFNRLLLINCLFPHARRVAYRYHQLFGRDEYVHVRSNISEIGRQGIGRPRTARDVDLARIWLLRQPGEPPLRKVFDAIEAFGEYAEASQFFESEGLIDLPSLYHMEHRMASWHSQVIAHSDPAFDTLSLYNCREVLRLMLSVDIEERLKARVHKGVIEKNWPELTQLPINGVPYESFPAKGAPTAAT